MWDTRRKKSHIKKTRKAEKRKMRERGSSGGDTGAGYDGETYSYAGYEVPKDDSAKKIVEDVRLISAKYASSLREVLKEKGIVKFPGVLEEAWGSFMAAAAREHGEKGNATYILQLVQCAENEKKKKERLKHSLDLAFSDPPERALAELDVKIDTDEDLGRVLNPMPDEDAGRVITTHGSTRPRRASTGNASTVSVYDKVNYIRRGLNTQKSSMKSCIDIISKLPTDYNLHGDLKGFSANRRGNQYGATNKDRCLFLRWRGDVGYCILGDTTFNLNTNLDLQIEHIIPFKQLYAYQQYVLSNPIADYSNFFQSILNFALWSNHIQIWTIGTANMMAQDLKRSSYVANMMRDILNRTVNDFLKGGDLITSLSKPIDSTSKKPKTRKTAAWKKSVITSVLLWDISKKLEKLEERGELNFGELNKHVAKVVKNTTESRGGAARIAPKVSQKSAFGWAKWSKKQALWRKDRNAGIQNRRGVFTCKISDIDEKEYFNGKFFEDVINFISGWEEHWSCDGKSRDYNDYVYYANRCLEKILILGTEDHTTPGEKILVFVLLFATWVPILEKDAERVCIKEYIYRLNLYTFLCPPMRTFFNYSGINVNMSITVTEEAGLANTLNGEVDFELGEEEEEGPSEEEGLGVDEVLLEEERVGADEARVGVEGVGAEVVEVNTIKIDNIMSMLLVRGEKGLVAQRSLIYILLKYFENEIINKVFEKSMPKTN